ncbi:Acetyltransferase, GNAT family protein [Ketogulonicigenium robustum]|uniref:Acetyltransferase, GNAT family protein n=1 Tax=Ketogulonicigenium robustum TaxID=92947 RepID=A0A1W6NY89_9RHOB|nr:GNAT family N-acetyltransferase [Ketogulonicigenium robustum]ARO14184.1 Acetyltransferase, GNAT family protein [Ketogulonicigenium robustum]
MPDALTISPLPSVPQFADVVAARAWAAWWQDSEVTLADYRARLEEVFTAPSLPAAWVAHRGDVYCGSVLLIDDDLDSRPDLTPWIAALWVEPAARGAGVAMQLQAIARAAAAQMGFERVFLTAAPSVAPYYHQRGYILHEAGVEGLDIFSHPVP